MLCTKPRSVAAECTAAIDTKQNAGVIWAYVRWQKQKLKRNVNRDTNWKWRLCAGTAWSTLWFELTLPSQSHRTYLFSIPSLSSIGWAKRGCLNDTITEHKLYSGEAPSSNFAVHCSRWGCASKRETIKMSWRSEIAFCSRGQYWEKCSGRLPLVCLADPGLYMPKNVAWFGYHLLALA